MDEVSYSTDITYWAIVTERCDTDKVDNNYTRNSCLVLQDAGWACMHCAVIHTIIIVGTLGEIPTVEGNFQRE
jgi:hypothetical protein